MIFVFGSNEAGVHGAGAAKEALLRHGAEFGKGVGHVGNSYGIPTKDKELKTLPLTKIIEYVRNFNMYAIDWPELQFKITQIGCGLAGLKAEQIAPMFKSAPGNCYFDTAWKPFLGEEKNYWGTF